MMKAEDVPAISPGDPDDLIELEEAAGIAGCDTSTLRRALRGGLIKGKKFGNSWAVYKASLIEWRDNIYNPNMKRR